MRKAILALIPGLAFAQSTPFSDAAKILQSQQSPHPVAATPPSFNPAVKSKRRVKPETRLIIQANHEPLSYPALQAVQIAGQWQGGDPLASAGDNGAVRFVYGAALAPVVCSPERLTTISLEVGEAVKGEPKIGDERRWEITPMQSGTGTNTQTLIVIKPRSANIGTDLIVTTDRRTYRFQLIARPLDHVSSVEFSYPEEEKKKWEEYQQVQLRLTAEKENHSNNSIELNGETNFGYTIKVPRRHAPPFIPKTVYDDGNQEFIKMPKSAEHWDAPVLQVAGPNGCEIVNYRKKSDTYIVDRLFDSATLISGSGKTAQRVFIFRDGAKHQTCGKHTRMEVARAAR